MSFIRAIVVDPEAPGRFAIKEIEAPQAGPSQALVQVEATSVNRGDVGRSYMAAPGWVPGWDLAGTVIQQAADGTGPKTGSRVVGMVGEGSWAEQVAVSTRTLAEIPDDVSFADAATLPVAGLTALCSLEKGGGLLNKRIWITGSTGGVGLFTHQLAKLSGAYVVGTARTASKEALVREAGADEVVIGEDLSQAAAYGPYHLIIESLAGQALGTALSLLAPGGTCVTLGWSAGPESTINVIPLVRFGTTLCGLNVDSCFTNRTPSEYLARLAQLVASQQLRTNIEVEASWQEVAEVSQRLWQRQFNGKAVLHFQR